MDAQTLLQAAEEVARKSGDVALGYFRQGVTVDTKGDGTPVTVADQTAEKTAREWIEARFPEDGILGEEFGETRAGAKRRWILDPIDGTKTFIRGVPLWGTLVAVAEGEKILAGAAYFPPVGEMLVAAPGQGCWWNGKRTRVSAEADLSKALVLSTDERFLVHPDRGEKWRTLTSKAAVARTWGDCYGYLLLATGRAEVMVDELLSPWDAAALQPIVEEAGGVFTDWTGARTSFGGNGIATNAALAEQVRELLGAKRA
ncbi:histidinol-phosphatase [Archangium violaceum]|uniref:histidinol-phosphatase n=1 Tax=Archangium violaceum TaxID=83451 RepID=UPI002B28F543|nr:histidinol-phosphatase [Archangium gephyra]